MKLFFDICPKDLKWVKSKNKGIYYVKYPLINTTKCLQFFWFDPFLEARVKDTTIKICNDRRYVVTARTHPPLLLLFDHFWTFFWQLSLFIWQNWGSDGHFEVLNGSELQLANSQNVNGCFSTISSQFSVIYIGSDGHFDVLNGSEPQLV